jgi:glutamate synthase (NADPH/NADH) large chain
MSGGVAYVLDLPVQRVNGEMVDLEQLEDDDRDWLRGIVAKHLAETESAVARTLLADWDANIGRFTKIMPRDYKRVLVAMADAQQRGVSVEQAVMEAVNG